MSPKATPTVRVEPEDDRNIPRIYANFAQVRPPGEDYTIVFCEVEPPYGVALAEAKRSHTVRARVKAKICFPTEMMPRLIAVMADNWQKYQKAKKSKGHVSTR